MTGSRIHDCNCAEGNHRLGGVFRHGDKVLVHYQDGSTEDGVVHSATASKTQVLLGDRTWGVFHTDRLWLVEP